MKTMEVCALTVYMVVATSAEAAQTQTRTPTRIQSERFKTVTVSNVIPRRTTDGQIINAHAGGIYQFADMFYLIGEHYKNCPHAGGTIVCMCVCVCICMCVYVSVCLFVVVCAGRDRLCVCWS